MADSSVQLSIERHICKVDLPNEYFQSFEKKRLPLAWGALFEFDAVSADETIVAVISTSKRMTSGGKHGTGKTHKVLLDLAFLFGTECDIRLGVFTEECMWRWAQSQQVKGRIAPNIKLKLIQLSDSHRLSLEESRLIASNEVRPR